MDSEKLLKVAQNYSCECCDYITCKKSSYIKHMTTDKHKKTENDSKMVVNDSEKSQKVAQFECNCGKIYKYDSGYYRHKKNCVSENDNKESFENSIKNDADKDELIIAQNFGKQLQMGYPVPNKKERQDSVVAIPGTKYLEENKS